MDINHEDLRGSQQFTPKLKQNNADKKEYLLAKKKRGRDANNGDISPYVSDDEHSQSYENAQDGFDFEDIQAIDEE